MCRATHRSQLPVSNLKERIAALEQRNAESVQRATSPTPSITSNRDSTLSGPSNGALRDKIARFEKKGGVPVPRGRFGLGAPPTVEGPRKRGELYGNRIPVPVRTISGGTFPANRPGSILSSYDQRRSFSASSVITDFDDDHVDYSPISSPTFTLPPDSPDSATSLSSTPEVSPLLGDFSNLKQNVARGTSFAQALEVARKAETEKQERQNSTDLASRSPLPEVNGHIEMPTETPPIIVVSSEDVSPAIKTESTTANTVSIPLTPSIDRSPLEEVHPDKDLSDKPPETIIANGIPPGTTTITRNPLMDRGVARSGTPPLNIRKRTLVDPTPPSIVVKDLDTNAVPTEPQGPVSTVTPNPQAVEVHDISVSISDTHKKETVDSLSELEPKPAEVDRQIPSENVEMKPGVPETLPLPDIVILNEQDVRESAIAVDNPSINPNAGVWSPKAGLTLDSEKLNDQSPHLQSGMPECYLKMLTLNFNVDPVPLQVVTAPPGTLESFSTVLKAVTFPDSFLSPPGTGMSFESPSSGDSTLSSLGSHPMSMETSPQLVTQMLRMTPATGRGIPMFLPANQVPTRQSDFVHFPPTPEDETTNLGRISIESDPEDVHDLPSKQTFSAVVHRKVREIPSSANNKSSLPQTPQPQRVKRATILETPLSPGHGELAALLQEAVLLENTLTKGELPSENPEYEEEVRQKEKRAREEEAAAAARAKAEAEERSRVALASAQLQSKRDEPTSGRLKHTFLVPLSKARSQNRKEVHTTKADTFFSKSEEPLPVQPKSADLPSQSTTSSARAASATLPRVPDKQPSSSATQPAKKSPRFASLRKFGSVSRGATVDGSSARTSHSISSELSSDESSSVLNPENSLEFGQGTGSTLSFPLVSPKKTSNTIVRATSFAEKLWSRTRTKSGGSTLSSTSEVNGKTYSSSTS